MNSPAGATHAVDIVIPCYNAESTLVATLESALGQTFTDFRLTLIDNASTDRSVEIALAMNDPRIVVLQNDDNIGPIPNWNRAIEVASAPYVKLLCADDLIDPTLLERQVAVLADPANADVVMVACRRRVIDHEGRTVLKARGLRGMSGKVTNTRLFRRTARSGTNPIGEPGAVLVRTEAIKACLPWDERFPYLVDVEMWTRLVDHGMLYAIPRPLASFRVADASWSSQVAHLQHVQARAFCAALRERHPEEIRSFDYGIGYVNAAILSRARRAVYWWLGRGKRAQRSSD